MPSFQLILLAALVVLSHHKVKVSCYNDDIGETWKFFVNFGLLSSSVYSSAADALFVLSKLGTLWALNAENGAVIWRVDTNIVSPSSQASQPIVSSETPTLNCKDTVFVGGLYAINACTGAVKWQTRAAGGTNYSSPSVNSILIRSSNNTMVKLAMLYVNSKPLHGVSLLQFIYALNGTIVLSRPLIGMRPSHPVVAMGVVCICTVPEPSRVGTKDSPKTNDGFLYAFNATSGYQLWAWAPSHGTSFLSAPVMSGISSFSSVMVYAAHQNPDGYYGVSALLAVSGKVQWTFRTQTRVATSPAISNDAILYFGTLGGVVTAVLPSGQQSWACQLNAAVHATPTLGVGNGILYVGTTIGTLFAIETKTGHVLWHYQTSAPIISSVTTIYANNTLIVTSSDGAITRLESDYYGKTHTPTSPPTSRAESEQDLDPNSNSADNRKIGNSPVHTPDDFGDDKKGPGKNKEGRSVDLMGEQERSEYDSMIVVSAVLCVVLVVVAWRWSRYTAIGSTCLHWKDRLARIISGVRGTRSICANSSRRLDLVPLTEISGFVRIEGPNPFGDSSLEDVIEE